MTYFFTVIALDGIVLRSYLWSFGTFGYKMTGFFAIVALSIGCVDFGTNIMRGARVTTVRSTLVCIMSYSLTFAAFQF